MLSIISTIPSNFQGAVFINVIFEIEFSGDLDSSSITEHTLILADDPTETLVNGSPGYVFGTRTAKFTLFEYLKKDTDYTFVVVGGENGIKTKDGLSALANNIIIRFRTGDQIDLNLALAKRSFYTGPSVPFMGTDGIYQQVYDKTGEPISHIVTTDGTVAPGGNIIPGDPDVYILPSGVIGELAVVSTSPVNNAVDVKSDIITISFSNIVTNLLPGENVIVTAERLFDDPLSLESPDVLMVLSYDNTELVITLTNFSNNLKYTVTIKDRFGSDFYQLSSDYIFSFASEIKPFYTVVSRIRLQLGDLITDISDDDIIWMIYARSLEISQEYTITDPPQLAAVKYVICSVKLGLIQRRLFEGGPITQKTLADLTIRRGNVFGDMIGSLIKKLEYCINENTAILDGYSGFSVRSVVRAGKDARRPSWKRLKDSDFGS